MWVAEEEDRASLEVRMMTSIAMSDRSDPEDSSPGIRPSCWTRGPMLHSYAISTDKKGNISRTGNPILWFREGGILVFDNNFQE